MYKRIPVAFGLVLLLAASTSFAQSTQLNIPRDSQRASVTQRVGITDITVKYHRPLVKGTNDLGEGGSLRTSVARRRQREHHRHVHRCGEH